MEEERFDIFISYASEELDWVEENVYQPLMRCVLPDRRRPRIYLDKSDCGLKPGDDFRAVLYKAVISSRFFIPIYSDRYFQKQFALDELNWAFNKLKRNQVVPVAKDPEIIIPGQYANIHCQKMSDQSWLFKLTEALGLTMASNPESMRVHFATSIGPMRVNNTMPLVRVELMNRNDSHFCEETVEISSSSGTLQGTLKKKTKGGIAKFSDLSIGSPSPDVTLMAHAQGYTEGVSNVFAVEEFVPPPPEDPALTTILVDNYSDVFFFESGKALAVVSANEIATYSTNGGLQSSTTFSTRMKIVRRKNSTMVFLGWDGQGLLLNDDYLVANIAKLETNGRLAIPGDCVIVGGDALVGYWNGALYRYGIDGTSQKLLQHDDGINCFAVLRAGHYICDLHGNLTIYENGIRKYTTHLEPTILGIKVFTHGVVVVGEQKAYQLPFGRANVIAEKLCSSRVSHVAVHDEQIMLVDEQGLGFWIDENLNYTQRFHTVAGARPLTTQRTCQRTIFRYPDASSTLLENGKIVYTHKAPGALDFDNAYQHVALGDENTIKIYPSTHLNNICRE